MPEFEIVAIQEAMMSSAATGKRSQIAQEYGGYIARLSSGEAADSHRQKGKPLPLCAFVWVRLSRRRKEAYR